MNLDKGYLVIPEFLNSDFISFSQQYFFVRIKSGAAKLGDRQAPNSYSFYGDPFIETILETSSEKLSDFCGIELLPTYSYTRLYKKGDELVKHRDRASCEISVTISLGFSEAKEPNPLYFSVDEECTDVKKVILNPGDACIYRGCDIWHWRDKFVDHEWYLQTFLHYVDKNGPYKEFLYDKRPYLGMKNETHGL